MSATSNWKKMMKAANVDEIVASFRQVYNDKYYDLFCSRFDVEGFDYRHERTLKSNLFAKGTVWVRKDSVTGEPVCCDYAASTYDWNNLPATVQLVTYHNPPETVIPTKSTQTVDKDGVILWCRPGMKGYKVAVDYYIGKLAEAETLITVNLALQRCPWILTSDSSNYSKLKLLLDQIFTNSPAIITDIDKTELDHITLNTPWLVDKLTEYEERLENKLKTILGLDNQGGYINREQQNLDTTNSNNDEINASQDSFLETLRKHVKRANEVLGLSLRVIDRMPKAEHISKTEPDIMEEEKDD